jgi:ABC-type amino acid transport substrate-binding protein
MYYIQCRAVAAAIFGNKSDDKVEYTTLDGFSRFRSLQEGRVDLLARSTTHTMERALNEVRWVGFDMCSLCLCVLLSV